LAPYLSSKRSDPQAAIETVLTTDFRRQTGIIAGASAALWLEKSPISSPDHQRLYYLEVAVPRHNGRHIWPPVDHPVYHITSQTESIRLSLICVTYSARATVYPSTPERAAMQATLSAQMTPEEAQGPATRLDSQTTGFTVPPREQYKLAGDCDCCRSTGSKKPCASASPTVASSGATRGPAADMRKFYPA
jgi:hypothetical protein